MRGYDLLKEFQQLTEQQRYDAVSYFLAGPSMDFEGFRDCEERPEYPRAKYCLDQFQGGIRYAQGVRISIQPIELEPGPVEVKLSNEWPKEYGSFPDPSAVWYPKTWSAPASIDAEVPNPPAGPEGTEFVWNGNDWVRRAPSPVEFTEPGIDWVPLLVLAVIVFAATVIFRG